MADSTPNRVYQYTSSTGQGNVVMDGAAVFPSFFTADDAVALGTIAATETAAAIIEEGDDVEVVEITVVSTSPFEFSRDAVVASRISGVAGTTKMSLGGSATVQFVISGEKFDAKIALSAVKEIVSILIFDDATDATIGDGAGDVFWRVPSFLNGYNLTGVAGQVQTAGTTGTTDVQIARIRSGTPADMLSTKLTIDSGEIDSSTAATAAVINGANDDVATGDQIRIDVDATSTTKAKGLLVELTFTKP